MKTFFKCLSLVAIILLQFSASVFAGTLDDYYLQRFGEATADQLEKAVLSVSTDVQVQERAQCGMPLKHDLRRDWDLLEQTTQKVLAKQLAFPVLTGELTYISSAGHFKVHYAAIGADAPPPADTNFNGIPDWVETVAATFETVRASYIALGYNPVPTSGGVAYDIYLRDLATLKYYGVTTSSQPAPSAGYPNAYTSWMEIDNNFTDSIYHPTTYTPLQSLQITAAHEYHHAIHFGYTIYFDAWYAEATSTWMEDELYDNVNQLYNYISAWFIGSTKSLDLAVGSDAATSGAGYSRWIFNRYLAEEHTPGVVLGAWQKLAGLASPGGGADIPMAPVLDSLLSSTSYNSSLGNEFFGFTKRVYTREWTTRTYDLSRIPAYSPVATYSSYPVNSTNSPTPYVSLPAYSFAYYKFIPTSNVPTLTVYVNKTSGIQTALFKKVSGVPSEISADASGAYYTVNNFSFDDEVVLLITNTSSTDGHSANFSTDSMPATPTEPIITPTTNTITSGSSGGGGCFIATAAYGSYLHPKVQLLRNFRDHYLLTNAPGRAFVAAYYRYSPPLANFIASHDFLRATARLALTPLFVAAVYPLGTAATLLLMAGLIFRSLRRRIKAARALLTQGAQTAS